MGVSIASIRAKVGRMFNSLEPGDPTFAELAEVDDDLELLQGQDGSVPQAADTPSAAGKPLTPPELDLLLETIANAPKGSEVLDRCQEEMRRHLASVPDGKVLVDASEGTPLPPLSVYQEPKSFAADGETALFNVGRSHPLMVRCVDFNAAIGQRDAELYDLRKEFAELERDRSKAMRMLESCRPYIIERPLALELAEFLSGRSKELESRATPPAQGVDVERLREAQEIIALCRGDVALMSIRDDSKALLARIDAWLAALSADAKAGEANHA